MLHLCLIHLSQDCSLFQVFQIVPKTSRISRERLPFGKAAWVTCAVSSGTGLIGVGCRDIFCCSFLHGTVHSNSSLLLLAMLANLLPFISALFGIRQQYPFGGKNRHIRRGATNCARLGRRSLPSGAMNCAPTNHLEGWRTAHVIFTGTFKRSASSWVGPH